MTTRAREALADCEHALSDFNASANTEFQRLRWVAGVTLLRTVGLVLAAVDRRVASDTVKRRIDDAWEAMKATKPEPRIFHEFIDLERADVVHLYDISARVDVTIHLPATHPSNAAQGADWMPVVVGPQGGTTTTSYKFTMRDGPYRDRDPRELCREAIDFWRRYLDGIDAGTPRDM